MQRYKAGLSFLFSLILGFSLNGHPELCDQLDTRIKAASVAEIDSLIHLCQTNRLSVEDKLVAIGGHVLCSSIIEEHDYGITNGYLHLGLGYYLQSKMDSAIHFLNDANNHSKLHGFDLEQALSANWLGLSYQALGHFDLALSYQQDYLEIGQRIKNVRFCGEAMTNLGSIYEDIGDLDKSLEYHLAALDKFGDESVTENFLWAYRAVGILYGYQGNREESLQYLHRARRIGREMNFARGELWTLHNIIETYLESNIDSVKFYMQRAHELLQEIDNSHLEAVMWLNKSQMDYALNNEDDAWINAEKSYQIAKANKLSSLEKGALNWLVDLSRDYNNPTKEKFYLSIIHENYNNSKNVYRDRSLAIWSDHQNEILERKEENLELREQVLIDQRNKANARLLFGAGLLLIAASFVVIYIFRTRNDQIRIKNSELKYKNDHITNQLSIIALQKQQLEEANEQIQRDQSRLQNELSQKLIHLANKQEILDTLGNMLKNADLPNKEMSMIKSLVRQHGNESIWEEYDHEVSQNNEQFFARLAQVSPRLTNNDYRLAAMIKMNLSNKEIARLQSKTPESIHMAKSRLRKKLNLASDVKLESFFNSLTDTEAMA